MVDKLREWLDYAVLQAVNMPLGCKDRDQLQTNIANILEMIERAIERENRKGRRNV